MPDKESDIVKPVDLLEEREIDRGVVEYHCRVCDEVFVSKSRGFGHVRGLHGEELVLPEGDEVGVTR